MSDNKETILRATGLIIVEVTNSNPNGDPDRESDPRQRYDQKGEISPVSFKRKIRDLVEDKNGPVWHELSTKFQPELPQDEFVILESRGRKREVIIKEIEEDNSSQFIKKYWDARIFGNTFLEQGKKDFIRTGVVQFGMGVSVAPIEIERHTNTNKSGVEEGKDRGMAPLAYRIVQHGVYCIPFFVNPTAAVKTGCTLRDIELLQKLIPYAYTHTASYVRPFVQIRHAWYIEHKSVLGSCVDSDLIDALSPQKINDPEKPSMNWSDYQVPKGLPEKLQSKISECRDLMEEM